MRFILKKPGDQKGYSIVELLVVMAVMLVVSQAIAIFLKTVSTGTLSYRQKTYATEKALQMLEELRQVALNNTVAITVLDTYDDNYVCSTCGASPVNPVFKYCLTTKREITSPAGNTPADWTLGANALSGNPVSPTNGFVFVRHVTVDTDPLDVNTRFIYVRIFMAANNPGTGAASVANAISTNPIAEVYGTIKSLASTVTPAEVMDMYFIALESVPGWWSRTSNLIPLMQGSVTNLQARNPGLQIRSHWIRTMSFGRDQEYTPQTNEVTQADATGTFTKTYVYPGLINYDDSGTPSSVIDYYYLPTWFHARMNIDAALTVSSTADGYALADQFNHAVRYPDELNMYSIYQTIAANKGEAAPQPSLRMLLENLNEASVSLTTGTDYINSIILNLHGEMVPVVPLRNYADAAKDPLYYSSLSWTAGRDFRVVSHPEQLHYVSSSDTITVDVYAYDMNPPATDVGNPLVDVTTIFIPGATLANLQSISNLEGGSTSPYHWVTYTGTSVTSNLVWESPTNILGGYASTNSANPVSGSATWEADNYTAPTALARSGLRIQLFGVTATARPYYGSQWGGGNTP